MDQSSSAGAPAAPSVTQKITLNILSPSDEVPDKLTFNDCPTSTTVAELKLKICGAVATRPAPERQRLIYRGKPLTQDSATLGEVFSQEVISDSSDHSLHLVLPPSVASRSATPSLPQPQPIIQRPHHSAAQQPSTVSMPPPGQRGGAHMHFVPPHLAHAGSSPHPHAQFPPHLQQALNNHLQALSQQIATQIASHASQSGPPIQQPPQAQAQMQGTPHSQIPPQTFQQVIAQQQQLRAAAGLQGVSGSMANQTSRDNTASPGPDPSAFSAPNALPVRASTPANVNTVVRENQSSSGESWRMVIQSTSTVTAQNPQLPRVPTPVNMNHGMPSMPASAFAGLNSQNGLALTHGQLPGRMLENELSSIQSALMRGTAPAPSVFENARALLRNVEAAEGESRMRSRLDHLSMQADQLRTNLNNMLMQVGSEQPVPSPSSQFGVPDSTPFRNNGESSVYLLSSPGGPQALLVSPYGTYSAPWHVPALAPASFPHTTQYNAHQPPHNNPVMNLTGVTPQNPPRIPAHDAPAPAQHQQQQQNLQANEARDLLRLLIPLGGHIWLLIRLFGFVYFFTAGGGSRRTVILGAFAFLVFVAQTGVFRPFLQAVWEPLRRHVEGLLPVPGNEPARALIPEAGVQNPTGLPASVRAERQHQQPTPQEAAARLLNERERRDTGVLREQIRRVERAVALFVGSLVPGFGERHIAARGAAEAAEAARLVEERRREDATRRSEEERDAQASGRGVDQEPQAAAEGQGSVVEGQAQSPPAQTP
ncbi:MAG: hypothetical protein Q9195_004245 [Heterodermia aff. obscurata]